MSVAERPGPDGGETPAGPATAEDPGRAHGAVHHPAHAGPGAAAHRPTRSGWGTRSQLLVALLCALLGFAIVVQVRQTRSDELALMRQDDLVRLLDEITLRNDQLEAEQAQLTLDRNELRTGADAQEVAERTAQVQGILAGTVAVEGPGIDLLVREQASTVPSSAWVNLVEELRNAGAEAIEIDGVRVGAATWFADADGGVVVDGEPLSSPVTVRAIGDPQTLEVALQIPGGALATLRSNDALTTLEGRDRVEILAVRDLVTPDRASRAPDGAEGSG
ncbi:DUF881 domain-containing protein [Litorihabitans aurantiacus]|uniref:Membrane protein n=1 Tax=Litorihabitans aurantiacus TaxID=1930061 RepID=A0AA37UHZ2_9MICO|nr:DUF881 domain-containing protein [Litorihabitans aurantiacus]GMA31248.1 membrane protein [Litorihabitans aurantiacus]